ncbi:hypothetical protein QJS10_CPA06g01256 [Acorus calamus]|uniref:DUF4283 domain-containing protein n=1 Tax=Acorus calamus TaxID=4465 RepID=A0AAV9EGX1_ACOCL|nr:hypothetical protein QJS10_CPA06g01256 [Acorus calamus]
MTFVVEGGPWTMDHRPFILRKWSLDLRMEQESLSSTPIWARLPNLPTFLWDSDTLSRIGSLIGTLLFMDTTTLKGSRATYARLYIEVEAIKPLSDSVVVEVSPGTRKSFKVEYDWNPSACQFCHSFGHDEALCGKKPKVNDMPVTVSHQGFELFRKPVYETQKAAKEQRLTDTTKASSPRASNSFNEDINSQQQGTGARKEKSNKGDRDHQHQVKMGD